MKTRTASRFVWHDLESADPDRVFAFDGDVMGWRPEPHPAGPMRYWTWMRDGTGMGGIGELTDEARARGGAPGWKGYVVSTDVDADVERVVALGGRVRMPAHTLETVGRMAVVEDPHGAPFALFAPDMSAPTNPAPAWWSCSRSPRPWASWRSCSSTTRAGAPARAPGVSWSCSRTRIAPSGTRRGLSRQALDHYFRVAEQRWGGESLVVRRVGLARGDHG